MTSEPRAPIETAASLGADDGSTTESTSLAGFLAGVERKAYRLARAALWDHQLALDTVQDSMLKLLERYAQRPSTEWGPLFFTILNNRIADMRRHRRWRSGFEILSNWFDRGHGAEDEPAERSALPDDEPEPSLIARRDREAISRALSQLPDRQREVFLLREWQGMSVKEAAQALACSEGTIKQHHFRALQRLRALLAEVHP